MVMLAHQSQVDGKVTRLITRLEELSRRFENK